MYLVDNMGVALALERRLTNVHRLLVHVRRCAALCLCRDVFSMVRWTPSEFNTSDAGSRKYDPFCDASQSVLAQLEENTRALPDIVSHQTAVWTRPPVRAQYSIHHATATQMVLLSFCTIHIEGRSPPPIEEVVFEKYSRSWSGHVPFTWWDGQLSHPSRAGFTCRLQDEFEPWSGVIDTATTPRTSGDLAADPCQQRLGLTQQLEQQRRGEEPGLRLAKSGNQRMAVCQWMTTRDSREEPQAAPRTTWRNAADLTVRGFPQMATYLMISVLGNLRPSEGLRASRVSTCCRSGVSEFWSV